MRKNILGALIASAFAVSGTAHAGLIVDLNGSIGGAAGTVQADAFDWSQTSFAARGGNTAISNFAAGNCGTSGANCRFDVMTHAVLTTYTETGTGTIRSAQNFGQITMVARYTEQVVSFTGGAFPNAVFSSTGAGSVEFYYTAAGGANDLTGSGFNSGRLIGRLNGTNVGRNGAFFVTSTNGGAGVALDQTSDGNQYTGQNTVNGFGSQEALDFGLTAAGTELDQTFFLTGLAGFRLNFENISIGLPYGSVNPSDCFNDPLAGRTVGTGGYTSTCDNNHVNGLYSAQGGPGFVPNVGLVNGLNLGSPDFVAQTDFNSAVNGVPEPGSLVLAGLALAAAGVVSSRRRRA